MGIFNILDALIFIVILILLEFSAYVFIQQRQRTYLIARYYEIVSIVKKFNENKSYRFVTGPLAAFFQVEIRYLEYLNMPEEQIRVLDNARRNRKTLIIDEVIPQIIQKQLNLSSSQVLETEANQPLNEGLSFDEVDNEKSKRTSQLNPIKGKHKRIGIEEQSKQLAKYTNEQPQPYKPSTTRSLTNKAELNFEVSKVRESLKQVRDFEEEDRPELPDESILNSKL